MELEDLIDSIDIVEYISQFVELTEKNGEFWGLSPFKDEKTPSFSVRREANNFYDFSSGIGGNVFTFVKHYNNCSSKEAVEILEKYAGCDGQTLAPRKKLAATIICKKFKPLRKNAKTSSATVFKKIVWKSTKNGAIRCRYGKQKASRKSLWINFRCSTTVFPIDWCTRYAISMEKS